MKIDGPFYATLEHAAKEARRLAAIGYDGVYSLEGSWDPFLPLALASEHALPAVERGLDETRRSRAEFTLQVNAIVITGESDEVYQAAEQGVKGLLGFYASTPAYRPPMDATGFGDLQPRLNALSKDGKWDQLGRYINDEFLQAFCTRGKPDEIAAKLREKYGKYSDRLAIYAPYAAPDEMWAKIVRAFKA